MPYNRTLYTHESAAIDAAIIYDQTQQKMQDEINSQILEEISSGTIPPPESPSSGDVLFYDGEKWDATSLIGTQTPEMNGIANVGDSYLYAREDHVHPVDTSRLPDSLSKTIVCIGDSWLQGWTPDGTFKSWGGYLSDFLGKTVNTDFFMGYYGGAGFMATADGHNFLSLLTDIYNNITVAPSEVTAVIVCGGGNDRTYSSETYTTQFTTAVKTFVTTARNYFPNATVYVGAGSVFVYSTLIERIKIPGRLQNACIEAGAVYIGNIAAIMLAYKEYYASDEKHPLAAGGKALALRILNAIRGGSNAINKNSSSFAFGGTNIWNYIVNDHYILELKSGAQYDMPSSKTVNNCNGKELLCSVSFDNNSSYYLKTAPESSSLSTDAAGSVHDSSGWHNVSFHVDFVEKTIRFYPYSINSAGSGFLKLTNADKMHVAGLRLMCPVDIM